MSDLERVRGELLTGRPAAWARDFGIVGMAAGGLAPGSVLWPGLPHPAVVLLLLGTTAVGGVLGATLGAMAPSVLDELRKRVPLEVLGVGALGVGGFWGAATAAVGSLTIGGLPEMVPVAAIAGASTMGLLFLPYTVAAVMRLPRWPLVLAACGAAPLSGPISLALAGLFLA